VSLRATRRFSILRPIRYGRAAHRLPRLSGELAKEHAMRRSLVVDAGLDKLQQLLLEMEEGDEISAARAHAISGLEVTQCDAVLEALTRAGLLIRLQGDAYIRRHLAE
jgi:hypothetical protein